MPETPPASGSPASPARLFLVSFLILLLEMAVIRWTSSQFRVLAYFGNIVLLACFLGLSVGCLAPRRWPRIASLFPWLLLGLFIAVLGLREGRLFFRHDEGTWLWQESSAERGSMLRLPMLVVPAYLWIALLFTAPGQWLGRAFEGLEPLRAYTWNIAGSLAGVAAQVGMSFLSLPACVWFGVCAACTIALRWDEPRRPWVGFAVLAVGILALALDDVRYQWSPYYKIERRSIVVDAGGAERVEVGFELRVNEDYHQAAYDLRDAMVRRVPDLERLRALYDAPYRLHGKAGRVLVLGAGNGNDVAAALRAGAERVVAVELDPAILRHGADHPERPYADPRVQVVNDDARAYLQRTEERFDLVVFGYLDSHSLLSNMTSVRLDNFVYTLETLRTVRGLLADGGGVALTFFVGVEWLDHKIYAMLLEAIGRHPQVVAFDEVDRVYYVGARDAAEKRPPPTEEDPPVCDDDWPFLYMAYRAIPGDYTWILLLALTASVIAVRVSGQAADAGWLHFGGLGAGFMLVETRSITALALLFGSTWIVSAAVVAGILLAILAANSLVRWRPVPPWAAYLGLALGLAATYALPPSTFLGLAEFGGVLGTLLYCVPVVFAGILFAGSFRAVPNPSAALGANLMGAVVGGMAENFSMAIGLQKLVLVAICFYALSAIGLKHVPRTPGNTP